MVYKFKTLGIEAPPTPLHLTEETSAREWFPNLQVFKTYAVLQYHVWLYSGSYSHEVQIKLIKTCGAERTCWGDVLPSKFRGIPARCNNNWRQFKISPRCY
jgi:hypothetical protein